MLRLPKMSGTCYLGLNLEKKNINPNDIQMIIYDYFANIMQSIRVAEGLNTRSF